MKTVAFTGAVVAIVIGAMGAVYAFVPFRSFNLQCTLSANTGIRSYALRVELPSVFGSARVQWVGVNTHDLRVIRFDDTSIIADISDKLAGWPDKADAMSFRLNRISGAAEVNYLQSPRETNPKDPWSFAQTVLTEFSEIGNCAKTAQAF